MTNQLNDFLFFPAGKADFSEYAGGMIGMSSNDDDNEVRLMDLISCFFFPAFFGGGFFERAVDDFERAAGVAGLADQQVLECFVMVKVEADKYSLPTHGWRS